ncbi:MAG: ComF family protein [Psychrobacter sp.]|uniref:ComF family protein n=1 Tax=Psychrobacter sp. TaxID=56811 RepID=UPI00264808D7|nr:ComF family protein [Psychrobacter sp.]MDN5619917.1 ComF family protein [Psychrobacter sp.]
MRRLAPYTTGLWLAEYVDIRCQLCRVYRSTAPSQLLSSHLSPAAPFIADSMLTDIYRGKVARYIHRHLSRGLLCAHCHNSIAWLPQPFDVDIAAGVSLSIQVSTYYEYPIRQAIQAFKHHEDMTKLPLLLHALRQLPRPHGCHHSNSVIVAMPTTPQRLVKRGFDPVSILAAQLSKHWQIPLWQGVRRIDHTVSQQGLTRAERLSNLDNAFRLADRPPVKRLLLFDDVATTGASLQALGRALYKPATNTASASSLPTNRYHLSAYALAHGSQYR